ncbi:MAG: hypothetical protein GXZ04_03900 [Clostridiales bacterium]|nr:hypothetical protein [Clostridiales bacterium]
MKAIYQKELKSYFYTATGWLFIAVFLSITGLVFYLNNILQRSSEFTQLLSMMGYVWMLLTPALVLRLLAGEHRQATYPLLRSVPLSVPSLVIGKYLAAVTVLLIAVILSFLYPLLVAVYGKLYFPEVLTGYIGFFLQGCAFIALDMMVTSNIKSHVSAAALSFGMNLFVWLISMLSNSASIPRALSRPIAFFSLYDRFVPFLNAQFSFANTLFYLLFILCMLTLSAFMITSARARKS